MLQSWLQDLAQRYLEADDLVVSGDGSVPVHVRSGAYRLRLSEGRRPHIQASARMVEGVDLDPALLEEINDLNRGAAHVHVWWGDRSVHVAGEIVARTAELDDVDCLCDELARMLAEDAPRLARRYGGQVAFPQELEEDGP